MIASILIAWAACGILSAALMSRILSHGRNMARAQRSMNH